jgi:hypothetical protein
MVTCPETWTVCPNCNNAIPFARDEWGVVRPIMRQHFFEFVIDGRRGVAECRDDTGPGWAIGYLARIRGKGAPA